MHPVLIQVKQNMMMMLTMTTTTTLETEVKVTLKKKTIYVRGKLWLWCKNDSALKSIFELYL